MGLSRVNTAFYLVTAGIGSTPTITVIRMKLVKKINGWIKKKMLELVMSMNKLERIE